MKHYLFLVLFIILICISFAQNTLSINGLNEAKFIYRTAPDSLNAYFYDSFAFNLAYRNFSFGMKFIAELPKYSTEQTELFDELDANRLDLGWRELYASYEKESLIVHAGTTEETFGNGIVFRSYKDVEFDEDHRLESFWLKYDDKLKFKAIYGAIENPSIVGKYDLAYGADLQSPYFMGISLGASANAFRNLTASQIYNQRDVFGARISLIQADLDLQAETAISKAYHQPGIASRDGKAIYVNANYSMGSLSFGGAYKQYDAFQYRLHDLPTANHHNETLSDASASGEDEIGYQGFGTLALSEYLSLNVDYAEAWNSNEELRMNDAYAAIEWIKDGRMLGLSYGHIEKIDEHLNTWQQELIPALQAGIKLFNTPVQLQAEYKVVTKQKLELEAEHYEPKLQADFSLGKLSLSLGGQSQWEEVKDFADSRYWASLEAKYPIFSHSDLTVFAGKEAGGKVCRNGVCRYVAPFQGLKVELNTRF